MHYKGTPQKKCNGFHIHFINEQYGGVWYNGLQFPSQLTYYSLYLSKAALLYCHNGICLLWAWQVMLAISQTTE